MLQLLYFVLEIHFEENSTWVDPNIGISNTIPSQKAKKMKKQILLSMLGACVAWALVFLDVDDGTTNMAKVKEIYTHTAHQSLRMSISQIRRV